MATQYRPMCLQDDLMSRVREMHVMRFDIYMAQQYLRMKAG